MGETVHEHAVALFQLRLDQLEQASERHADLLEDIRAGLKQLVELQVVQNQILLRQTDHEDRLRAIEAEMPTLKQLRHWVTAAVTAGFSAAGAALWALTR